MQNNVGQATIVDTTCQSKTQDFILYTIKTVYCQSDMFRPLLDHLHLYFNALWNPTMH